MSDASPPAPPSPASWQGDLVRSSILAGLCPLIPVPYLDDFIQGYVVRHLVSRVFAAHGLAPDEETIRLFTREKSGWLSGCLLGVLLYPLKKMLKKLFFFLFLKGNADTAARWFHRGYLIDTAIRRGSLNAATLKAGQAALLPYQVAIEEILAVHDTSPVNNTVQGVFQSSRTLLRSSARILLGWVRRLGGRKANPSEVEEALGNDLGLAQLQSTLARALWRDTSYLERLEDGFLSLLEGGPDQPSGSDAA